jgi:GNAT superfamily N-acetyltransferase
MMASPGCSLWVATLRGEPVARGLGVFEGRLIGIKNVYVARDWRRRGLGMAITRAIIEHGARLGAEAACLEASEMGRPLYERMGFVKRYHLLALRSPDP